MAETLLEIAGLEAGYGAARVLDDITLSLEAGAALALLGRNGMGKTTFITTLMGHTDVFRGTIRLGGRDLLRLPRQARAAAGLGWVAQERDVFPSLTVTENLTVAARPGRWDLRSVYDLFPRLAERRRNLGTHLSGGEQQMLAIGRALMLNPTLMLLDEPLEGLAPVIVGELVAAIRHMVAVEGLAMILVEQRAELALALTRRAVVLERGRIIHHGDSADLAADPARLARLLGVGAQGKP